MQAIEAKYDIDNNEWLASVVNELDADSKAKAYAEMKNAKHLREEMVRFVEKSRLEINKADAHKSETAKQQLIVWAMATFLPAMEPEVAYDVDNNKWLADVIADLEAIDNAKRAEQENDAKATFIFVKKSRENLNKCDVLKTIAASNALIKSVRNTAATKAQQQEKATRAFVKKVVNEKNIEHINDSKFVEQRFVKKYCGADTVEAMVAMEEKKRCATREFTGMMHRREKINKSKYAEQASAKARAMRRKFAQRIK